MTAEETLADIGARIDDLLDDLAFTATGRILRRLIRRRP